MHSAQTNARPQPQAGKALSGGAAALSTATAPLRQLSPRVLALDATVGNLRKLTSFLEVGGCKILMSLQCIGWACRAAER